MSVASCVFLDRLRLKDFIQRREIEIARDQLRQLDEAKSRFTANIHHELRTPLTLMLAPLDSMLSGEFGPVSELQRSYLETMHKNALRLLKLINNLLDHARIEAGTMELHRQPLHLAAVARETVGSARALAERKGLSIAVECAPQLPVVHADPDALEKVFFNLVGNALKFTDPGGRITVSVTPAQTPAAEGAAGAAGAGEAADGVEIVVADTGVGLAPDQLERVFDRFAQVDGSATRRHEGTGIGLSLVRELVALHGGRAWATSEGLGRGAQFHVFLPIGAEDAGAEEVVRTDDGRALTLRRSFDARAADLEHHAEDIGVAEPEQGARYRTAELERTVERFEATRDPSAAPAGPGVRYGHGPEVVVAEDNADMRRLLVHLLAAEFTVRPARNGREALELVRARPPALVVTDVMMPEMSGTELCEAIKADPELAGIPVMLVTSKAERAMKIEGLERGADDYVTKPFHPRELLARARALVRVRSLQEELAEQNAALERALRHVRETEVQLIQAERRAAVGELAAGLAHEMNNPLNFALNAVRELRACLERVSAFVAGVAELDWRDGAKAAEAARRLQELEAESGVAEAAATAAELVGIVIEGLERTERLVADLRDIGTPRGHRTEPVELGRVLDSTLALVRPVMHRNRITVEREIAEGLPRVPGDPSALAQLLLNLLKNAAEALEETGGTVRIRAALAADGAGVEVSVSDDGPGIDPALAERIFEPFVTTRPPGRGTGLGLPISRRIAEAHGGSLALDATAGAGATFVLRLPLEAANATPPRLPG